MIEDVFVEDRESKKDFYIFKRLMKYARPYMLHIIISFILLGIVVAVEIIQPMLIAKGIDSIITKYDTPYSIVADGEGKVLEQQLYFNDKKLIKDAENNYPEALKARIVLVDESYYYIEGLDGKRLDALRKQEEKGAPQINEGFIRIDEKEFAAQKLTEEDLKLLRKNDYESLIRFAFIFGVIVLLGSGVQYLMSILLQYTGQKIVYEIRNDVFSHIQDLEIDFFNSMPIGKLVTRVTNDTETINEMYTSVIVNSVKNIFVLIGIVIAMISFNLKLSLLTYTLMPVLVIATIIFRRYSKIIYRQIRENVSKVNAFLSEHISGMKIIQVFAKEDDKYDEFNDINGKLNKSNKNQIIAFSIFGPSIYLIKIASTAIVIYFGGKFVLAGAMTIGALIAFTQYISRFFHPVQQLAEQFNVFQSAMASAERIFNLLDREPVLKDSEAATELDRFEGKIEFKNVWFAYKEDEWILKDVSFKINEGEIAAFVGATGAGKTTILNLIGKYYEIQKGEILIDDINIKDIKTSNLRKHIGQMLQDVFIYSGDIESNIKLRNEEITDEDMVEASKYVNAHGFIEKLPEKYKHEVYERGATLSAGQRQLLSFARTLVRKPSILILDEATANIDTETEKLIQDALYKIMKGRTTLAVAHRLSTIQHADKIIVMNKGRVKEQGTHQELLDKKGLYYKLVQLQYNEQ
ncbi:ABC transporter ATP-binding protein [Wukongibacter baidiensis]|uniref:ABC transporter ATP-binding protein n=1 Tax=Wukongibacter baidiensis TaxID=1723361 RepID=UPI003D7F7CD5